MFLIFSFDLLLYPSVLIKASLDNAVHWVGHPNGKGDVFVFMLPYFSIFCGVFDKIIITLALVTHGTIMTDAVPCVPWTNFHLIPNAYVEKFSDMSNKE